jgi:hypothetical protein
VLPKNLREEVPVPTPRGLIGSIIGFPKSGKTVTGLKLLYALQGYDTATFTPEVVERINSEGAPVLVVETMGEAVGIYANNFPFRVIRIPGDDHRLPQLKDIIRHYADNPQEGVKAILVDTFTAFWNGPGGYLDMIQKLGGTPKQWGETNKTIELPFFSELKRVAEGNLLDLMFTVRMKDGIRIESGEDGKMKTITKEKDKPIQRAGWSYDTDFIFTPSRNDRGHIVVDFEGRFYGLTPERMQFRADNPALNDFAGKLAAKLNRNVVKELV